MKLREFITSFGFDVDFTKLEQLDNRVGGVLQRLDSTSVKMREMAGRVQGLGSSLSLFVTAPLVAAGYAASQLAIDAGETVSKFDTVFRDIKGSADGAADALVNTYGLASDQARQLLGDTGDLLSGFGFTQQSALDLSNQVQQLAVDLASFTNVEGGAERASQALTKALLGERESVKELGIAILEEDVKARVAQLAAQGRFINESERERKAIATLSLAMEQSKNAIGDFARTQDSTANQQRLLLRDVRELALSFGKILEPAVRGLVKVLRSAVGWFNAMPRAAKTVIVGILGIVAVIGPLLFLLGSLGLALVGIQGAMVATGLAAAIAETGLLAFLGSALLAAAPILLLAAVIVLLVDEIYTAITGGETFFGTMFDLGAASDFYAKKLDALVPMFEKLEAATLNAIDDGWDWWKQIWDIGDALDFWAEKIERVVEWIKELGDNPIVSKIGDFAARLGITGGSAGLSPATAPAAGVGAIGNGATVSQAVNVSVNVPSTAAGVTAQDVADATRIAIQAELAKQARDIQNAYPQAD